MSILEVSGLKKVYTCLLYTSYPLNPACQGENKNFLLQLCYKRVFLLLSRFPDFFKLENERLERVCNRKFVDIKKAPRYTESALGKMWFFQPPQKRQKRIDTLCLKKLR